jgi:septal ring factor EnvC (AmiA/AmiB activator)
MEKIETDLSREKELVSKFHEREKALLDQLMNLEGQIAARKKSLGELSAGISKHKEELEKLRKSLNSTEKGLGEIEERLARRLLAFYKYAKRGHVQVLVASRDLEDLAKRAKYLRIVMSADQRLFQETAELQKRHKEEILQVREKLGTIERMEKEENDRLLGIKDDLDKKVLVLMKIHKERELYEAGVKELELAAKTLREKLISLEKTEVAQPDLPGGFSAAKGRLPLPCEGRVQRAGAGLENGLKGVFVVASSGADARAIFPGRVEFSGNLKGYGEIVVINHGSRYFTVTGYLDRRRVEEGKMVKAGDVIGTLGKDDAASGRLYFEIRRGGTNLDPIEWLKAH